MGQVAHEEPPIGNEGEDAGLSRRAGYEEDCEAGRQEDRRFQGQDWTWQTSVGVVGVMAKPLAAKGPERAADDDGDGDGKHGLPPLGWR